jgi:acyl transferase domain-containing protein
MQFILPSQPQLDVRALCDLAREVLAGLMQCEPSALPTDVALRDLGVDSRTTVALIAALSMQLNRALPSTLVYAYPTLDELARFLAKEEGEIELAELSGSNARAVGGDADLPVDEPIAIIGIGCRFPGGGDDPEAYFELLRNGTDAIIEAPRARDELWIDDEEYPGGKLPMRGGFLEDVASFDEEFFGISPREASEMDPQQRLMLEVSWEALEDAGMSPNGMVGSRTGVFVGAMWQDYAHHTAALATSIEQHTATGLDTSVIAARVSYRLGLRGPSLTVNTACSSALVAVHLACQSLRQRESTIALAGGVNLILSSHSSIAMDRFGALSPDGRCKAFDASANGYVRGEGAGIVVLKRLADAVAAGDPIYCVIRGSAINNDGASNGLAAPSGAAQVQVLRDAYARARVAPSRVHYVEAHGTGTRLGDPIEAEALGEVLGRGRSADRPLHVGSVKTNLGHLEAASGIASLIKVALAMRHGHLPASLHMATPNPAIHFDRLRLSVQQVGGGWPRPDEVPLAGVSGFGFGGTNAHIVLEGAHQAQHELLLVAADDARALQSQIERLSAAAQHVESHDDLRALCEATAQHWSAGRERKAIVVHSATEIAEQLERAAIDRAPAELPRIVFVFSGAGSQWPGMARSLMATEPVFRAALDRCDLEIEKLTGRSVLSDLWQADPKVFARCERYQPMIFAVQVALCALLESYGVTPDVVVGHSIGEVAAAHRAGILRLGDACAVICHMARLLGRAEGEGAMALLGLSASDCTALLHDLGCASGDDAIVIAAHNGPSSTVISGTRKVVARAAAAAQRRGVLTLPVQTEVAFHHPMVQHALSPLRGALAMIEPQRAHIPMWSTTDGAWLQGAECDGAYFQRNQAQPVRFAEAVAAISGRGPCSFVEIGPHPVLVRELREALAQGAAKVVAVPSMTRGDLVRSSVLDGIAALFRAGHTLRYRLAGRARGDQRRPLPAGARRFMPLSYAPAGRDAAPFTVPLAAHSQAALRRSATMLSDHLAKRGETGLADVVHKLARVRVAHAHRATVTASCAAELRAGLNALARGDHARGLVTQEHGPLARSSSGRLAFVFSGHGSQWAGMGCELLRSEPVFTAAIEACDAAFVRAGAERVRPQLEGGAEAFPKRADRVQPLLFAMQVALARLWLARGVKPDVVIGHSVGEVAAAHIAGHVDLDAAARIVTERAAALAPAIGQGAMALIELPLARAEALASAYAGRIAVAVHHSPTYCVLAGERDALAELLQKLDSEHVFCRWVDVDYASHGPQMRPIALDLHARLVRAQHAPSPKARFPMLSTTRGRALKDGECDATYWAENLSQPVLFREAIEQLARQDVTSYLEISPHPLLSNGIIETTRAATAAQRACAVVPSLRRNAPERHALEEALGQLFVAGHRIDWSLRHEAGELSVSLPSYPFERRRHWKSQPVMESVPQERTSGEYLIETSRRRASSDDATSSQAQLQGVHGEARSALLRLIVRAELAALVRCEATRIEPHVSLQDLGIDSLMGLQLRSRLETRTGVVLSSTRMWEKPTPEGLCEQLAMAI